MKYKKSLIFICLLICLFSIASVVASDVNETVVTTEEQSDEIININNQQNIETELINSSNDFKISSSENELLGGSYYNLQNKIWNAQNGDTITLNENYVLDSTILISKSLTIDGRGHTIYARGHNRFFQIDETVTLKNIIFKNAYSTASGAVYFNGATNCTLFNCSFVNCSSHRGGAVEWWGINGTLRDCSFVNCSSSYEGGAVYWGKTNGNLFNCNFVNCYCLSSTGYDGGAVYWQGINGTLRDCSFVNCSAYDGGAVDWRGINGTLFNCSFVNCSSSYEGGAVDWWGINGTLRDCSFVNCSSSYEGGAVEWRGDNGIMINCSFIKCYDDSGYAIYWDGTFNRGNGKIIKCTSDSLLVSGKKYIILKDVLINLNNIEEINFGSSTILTVQITENATGYIEIYIDNIYKTKTIERSYLLTNLTAGNHIIKTIFRGNDYYASCENTTTIKVKKINTTMVVLPIKLAANNTVLNIILDPQTTGTVIININDKNYTQMISKGNARIHIDDLPVGNYNYSIIFEGDQNFNNNILTGSLSIRKESNINISSKNITIDDTAEIDYIITPGVTGILSVYVNDIFMKNVSVGSFINLGYLKEGNYTIKVIYNGNDYYDSCEHVTKFNVEKYDSDFYFDNCIAGKNVAIDLVFDEDATGYVNIKFDEYTFYNKKLVNGKTTIIIPNLEGRLWHEYEVNYTGDERYKPLTEHDWNYAYPNDSPITLNIPELNWGDLFSINPTLPKDATGSLEILVDNVSLNNMSIGRTFRYNAINGGKHYLTVRYDGDEYFSDNETTFELNIKRFDSTLSINDTVYANPYSLIEVKLNEEINGFITVTINNKKYSGYVVNGTFTFNVNNFNIGSNNAIINFTGDSKYNPIYTVKEINVLLKDAKLSLDISNIIYGNDLIIKPTVVSAATGSFKIYVDDELKATKSVGSSYTLSKPVIGKHEIKIIYTGNSYFAQSELNEAFRVFKIYPIEANDTQIVYGSDKHFQAKFYDENGLALKNKYVQFSVANQDYPILTDSEGIAVLNVIIPVGEYNITSVSLLDESKTNKLLIFNSVQAENMVIQYGSGEKFKATFLDETAKPLSNTGVIFIVDGVTQPMVRTDVNGLAVLNQDLTLGTHTITSINTITGQNMTNKVIVVSDINAIMNVNDISDVSYTQNPVISINVGPAYLDGNVEIILTGDNGYKQTVTQKAAAKITREIGGLNAGKYTVNVVYHGSEEALIINSNKTFTVFKIDPTMEVIVSDYYTNSRATITINVTGSNGTVTLKVASKTYNEKLTNGKLVKTINGLAVGDYNIEVLFNGDNNYNPMIKTSSFKMYHNIDFKVNFPSSLVLYDDDKSNVNISQTVYMENIVDEDNDVLTLKIDGKLIEFSISGWTDEDGNDMGYSIEFGYGFLKEGEHTWEIKLSNEVNNLIGSKSGTFNVYRWSNFYDIFNFGLIDDPTVNSILVKDINKNVKNGTYWWGTESYQHSTYYISTFTYNGVKYNIIDGLGHAVMHNPVYIEFNPNDYALYDDSFYKIENGIIVDIISNYEILDGVYYRLLGCGEYTSSLDNSTLPFYFLMEYDGVCYKYLGGYKEAIRNVDYKIVDGKYCYMDGSEVGVLEGDDVAIINGYRYYIEDNYYNTLYPPANDLILINGNFYHAVRGEYDESTGEYKKHYVIDNGKLFIVENGAIGSQIKLKQPVSDNDINIPALPSSSGGSVSVKLPSDASGTITLSINGNEYNFTVAEGVANVKVPELVNGNYDYIITYSGDNKYASFTRTGNLTVNKILPTSITSSDITTVYNGGKYLVATLKDNNGKPIKGVQVSINLNGVKYLTTDANGQVKLSTNGLVPKSYTATITFAGNNNYAKSSTTAKVTVTKATPKLTASKKTYKAKVKTKKYTATLKDNNGKAIKKVKVTLKVKGKTYKATTNAKGQAVFKIKKLTKKGIFKATVKYAGNAYYAAVTKTVKIKLK